MVIYLMTYCNRFGILLDTWLYGEILQYSGYLYVFAVCIGCLFVDAARQNMFIFLKKIIRI